MLALIGVLVAIAIQLRKLARYGDGQVDMYDDPSCRHWVVVARQPASPSRDAAGEPVETLSARVS